MGKYGFYLNYDEKLYSVPACFQNDKFNLEAAIKIIDYKSKLIKEEKKLETESTNDEEIVDIVKTIKNKKSLKKLLMNSIYMNHYVNIMQDLDGKSDIPTDEELLLFSESESDDEPIELKKTRVKKIKI